MKAKLPSLMIDFNDHRKEVGTMRYDEEGGDKPAEGGDGSEDKDSPPADPGAGSGSDEPST